MPKIGPIINNYFSTTVFSHHTNLQLWKTYTIRRRPAPPFHEYVSKLLCFRIIWFYNYGKLTQSANTLAPRPGPWYPHPANPPSTSCPAPTQAWSPPPPTCPPNLPPAEFAHSRLQVTAPCSMPRNPVVVDFTCLTHSCGNGSGCSMVLDAAHFWQCKPNSRTVDGVNVPPWNPNFKSYAEISHEKCQMSARWRAAKAPQNMTVKPYSSQVRLWRHHGVMCWPDMRRYPKPPKNVYATSTHDRWRKQFCTTCLRSPTLQCRESFKLPLPPIS